MGTDKIFPESSVRNYHSTLRNSPEERKSHLHLGGSTKKREMGRAYWEVGSIILTLWSPKYSCDFQNSGPNKFFQKIPNFQRSKAAAI